MSSSSDKNLSDQFIIWVIILTQFATPFMFSGVAITLPEMGRELHASAVALGLVESVYLGMSAALLLPIGRIADATDRATLFKIGLVGYSLCTLFISFLPSIELIIAFRAAQGAFGALLMATGMAIISQKIPPERLGKVIGLSVGAVYAGLSAGPLIAGWITAHYGWRAVYSLTFIPLMISTLLAVWALPSHWQPMKTRLDWVGSVCIFLAMGLLIYGSASLDSVWGIAGLVSGFGFMLLFFFSQTKVALPLLDLKEMRANYNFSHALLTQLFMYVGAFGATFVLGLYLQSIQHFSPSEAGQTLVVGPILMAILAPLSGRLSDKFNKRILTTFGVSMAIISMSLALQLDQNSGLPLILAVIIFQGLGFAFFSSPNIAIIMSSVDASKYSLATALSAKMRALGMVFSMIIITLVTSVYLGKQTIEQAPDDYMQVLAITFSVFTGLLIIAWLFSASAIKARQQPDQVTANQ